jgi:hypothetical protein
MEWPSVDAYERTLTALEAAPDVLVALGDPQLLSRAEVLRILSFKPVFDEAVLEKWRNRFGDPHGPDYDPDFASVAATANFAEHLEQLRQLATLMVSEGLPRRTRAACASALVIGVEAWTDHYPTPDALERMGDALADVTGGAAMPAMLMTTPPPRTSFTLRLSSTSASAQVPEKWAGERRVGAS